MSRFTTRNSTVLTDRQQAVLDYVRQFYAENGICPSSRQVQQQFNLASQTGAMSHLNRLVKKGHLRRCPISGRIILKDQMIPWEDVKPLLDDLKERQTTTGFKFNTDSVLRAFFTRHPHLKL